MSIAFIFAVIWKVAATLILIQGSRAMSSFWIIEILRRERLMPGDVGDDRKKASRGIEFIRVVRFIVWAQVAIVAIAIWWSV